MSNRVFYSGDPERDSVDAEAVEAAFWQEQDEAALYAEEMAAYEQEEFAWQHKHDFFRAMRAGLDLATFRDYDLAGILEPAMYTAGVWHGLSDDLKAFLRTGDPLF